MYTFESEDILAASDPRSPFYCNLPPADSRPIDDLILYFKCWKKFIRSLIYYLREAATVKEFNARVNLQLINSVLFPGAMNLPLKVMADVTASIPTPPKEVRRTLSGTLLALMNQNYSLSDLTAGAGAGTGLTPSSTSNSLGGNSGNGGGGPSRPHLFKTKSNQSFLKSKGTLGNFLGSANSSTSDLKGHHRNISIGTLAGGIAGGIEKKILHAHTQNFDPAQSQQLQPQLGGQRDSKDSAVPHDEALKRTLSHPKASRHDDIVIPPNFFNPETLLFTNLPGILANDHFQAYNAQMRTFKEVNHKLVIRLESLLKSLLLKIKEIRSLLRNDSFANDGLAKEISQTGKYLNSYMVSVARYLNPDKPVLKRHYDESADDSEVGVLDDPFLLKLQLDYQLKKQLVQENYGFAAYLNLQNIARDLSNYVLKDLKVITNKFGKLVDQETCYNDQSITALYHQLVKITSSSKPDDEWNYFIANNKSFVNTNTAIVGLNPPRQLRLFSLVHLPYSDSIHNKCLRNGTMYKKLKILKNYNAFYYILTCNYLHEFKIPDSIDNANANATGATASNNSTPKREKRDLKNKIGGIVGPHEVPERLYNLNDYVLKPKSADKFILQLISNKSKRFTFKCVNELDMGHWCTDLLEILKFGPHHVERFEFVESKIEADKAKPKHNMKINLSGLAQSNLLAPSLSTSTSQSSSNVPLNGMFTPKIGTPQPLDSSGRKADEGNPFETNFEVPLAPLERTRTADGVVASPLQSPRESPSFYTADGLRSPLSSSSNVESTEVVAAHENYLRIQQDFLRRQQSILNDKLRENAVEQQAVAAQSPPLLHRDQSSGSISSMVLNPNLLLHLRQDSSSLIPKVFVSSNH
jgi:hypothetical protein